MGYEAGADTEAKVEARSTAIAEGKMSGEEWDGAVAATPKVFYAEMEETLDCILGVIALGLFADPCSEGLCDLFHGSGFLPLFGSEEEACGRLACRGGCVRPRGAHV